MLFKWQSFYTVRSFQIKCSLCIVIGAILEVKQVESCPEVNKHRVQRIAQHAPSTSTVAASLERSFRKPYRFVVMVYTHYTKLFSSLISKPESRFEQARFSVLPCHDSDTIGSTFLLESANELVFFSLN